MAKPGFEQAAVASARRRRVAGRLFAFLLVASCGWFAVHAATASGNAPAALLCTGGEWSVPEIVVPLPAGTFLRTPSLATIGDTLYVAGSPTPVGAASTPPRTTPSLLIHAVRGGEIDVPPGAFQFLNPRLWSDDGQLLLVWGESGKHAQDTLRTAMAPAIRVASLWSASYAPLAGWTTPAQLYAAAAGRADLLWNVESAGAFVPSSGRIELVIPRINGAALHVVRGVRTWKVDTLPMRAQYATVVATSTGDSYAAYIGTNPNDEREREALLFVRGTRDGRWEPPTAIKGAHGGVTRPRLMIRSDGVLFLLWGLRGGQSFGSDAVRAISSSDGGVTWSRARDLRLPHEMFTKWRPALDGCGTVHVVVSSWEQRELGEVGRLSHATLRPDAWTQLVPLTPAADAREIAVGTEADGTLRLLSSVRVDSGGAYHYDVRLASFRTPNLAKLAHGLTR